jgi:pimeloyl-ACP methyl ester carboxylesterase
MMGSAGSPAASAGAGAAAPGMPADVISLEVEPDREHLYEDASKWLCLPGTKDELCTTGLDATTINPDGTTEVEKHVPAADPSFDCFYVYPTVSNDTTPVADWTPGTEEPDCVTAQAGRYSRVCRVFAPLYRQITLSALNGGATPTADDRKMGYLDVVAAFNHYLTHYNQGRGFVLIGHSQGSGVLQSLIAAEIDGRPELRARLISAHLLGTAVAVPAGQDVGGTFKNIPVCRKNDQAGCVVAYSTFRDSSPPPSNSKFGKVAMGRAVCANPAALGGGKATLDPYLKPSQVKGGMRVTTPFVHLPDFLQGECVEMGDYTYLELSVLPGMNAARPTDVSADIGADWGLHLIDVHIAMGNLVDLAAMQAAAFAAQHH